MTSQLPLQGTSLWLNFSTAQVQTGILNTDGSWAFFDTGAGETLQLLFAQVQQSLSVVSGGWQGLQHIVYSRGPGNLLGLRIGAMALQTWRSFPGVAALPLWSYSPVSAYAWQLAASEDRHSSFTVVCRIRREVDVRIEVNSGQPGAERICSAHEPFSSQPVYPLPLRAANNGDSSVKTPFCLRNCVFSPAHQLALLRRETEIVLDTHTADDFVTWHGERHR